MTIADLSLWDKSKLVIRLFLKDNSTNVSTVNFLKNLDSNDLQNVTIVGRGGVEVSIEEIKKSHHFKEIQEYAKVKVSEDNGRTTDHSTTD